MTMGFTIGVLQFLTRRYSASTGQLAEDSQVYRISGEVGFLWFAGASLWVLTSLFPLYGWACCVVPMTLLIGRGERRRWPLTTAVGLALCGALVVPAFRSIALVESVRFSQQMPWGKLAFAEVLAVLWVAPLYVARLATASPFLTALRRIQTAVYLALPFVWLPTAARRWPEFQLLLPWGSALISGALALGLKKPSLKFERWILTTLAAGSSLIGAVDETHSLAQFTLGSWLG